MHHQKSIIIGIGNAGCNFIDNLISDKIVPALATKPKIIGPDLISRFSHDVNNIFLICGLGSLTSNLKVQTILDKISNKSAKLYLMGLLPFKFEGVKRIRSANNTIALLNDKVTKIFEFENQMLVDSSAQGTSLQEAFGEMDKLIWNKISEIMQPTEPLNLTVYRAINIASLEKF